MNEIQVSITAKVVQPENYVAYRETPSTPRTEGAAYPKINQTAFSTLPFILFLSLLFLVSWRIFYHLYPLFVKPK